MPDASPRAVPTSTPVGEVTSGPGSGASSIYGLVIYGAAIYGQRVLAPNPIGVPTGAEGVVASPKPVPIAIPVAS